MPFSRLVGKSTPHQVRSQEGARDVSQINRSIVAQPFPLKRHSRQAAAVAISAAIAAGTVAAAVVMSALTPATTATAPNVQAEDLERIVDGWMPAAAEAGAARLARLQDGYLPGLVAAHNPGDAVDGYLPGLLAARNAGDAVDGWEAGLLP
jgi:hypothetical protein